MKIADKIKGTFICHDCDALQNVSGVEAGNKVVCVCCGTTLFSNPVASIEKSLALIIASIIFFLIANLYPILTLNISGIESSTTLTDTAFIFVKFGNYDLALIVWLFSVVIPGFIIFGLLYILLSVYYVRNWRFTKPVLVWVSRLLSWGMMDVFLLSILVAMVKLISLADIVITPGFYAFVFLILTFAAATASIETALLWQDLDQQTDENVDREDGVLYE